MQTGQPKKKLAAEVGRALAVACQGEVAQVLGHTVLIYKQAAEDSKLREGCRRINLPGADAAGP